MYRTDIPDYIMDIRREDAKKPFCDEREFPGAVMRLESWPSCKGTTKVAIYRPIDADCSLPCFFFIHGGGWTTRNLQFLDDFCRLCTQICHICVVSPEYMLAPESGYPEMPQECLDCIEYARSHCLQLGIDITRMAIGGDSAGANLAAGICTRLVEEKKNYFLAQLLYYGAFDLTGTLLSEGVKPAQGILDGNESVFRPAEFGVYCRKAYVGNNDPADIYISPACASPEILKKLPRTFMAVGGKDSMEFQSVNYGKKLADSGVEVTYIRYPQGVHAILSRKTEGYDDLLKTTYRYLNSVFIKDN